jgi:hypothetical protein
VTTSHCAATARTPPWRSWQVGRARWRQSTGSAHHRGAPLAAGVTHVAGHAVTIPRVLVSPAWAHPLTTDLPRL